MDFGQKPWQNMEKMEFDNFEIDRTPKPLNHFQKVDTFLISTHRAY